MRGSSLLGLLVPVLALLGAHAPARAQEVRVTLRLMTYNIHHGAGTAGLPNLRATAAVIRRSGADLVALQEVDRVWGLRSMFRDQAARLAQALAMNLVFGATRDRRPGTPGHGEFGLAILSRFPLSAPDFRLLPGTLEQRGVLLAWAETPCGRVPVACTHLGLSRSDRESQLAEVLAWLPRRDDLIVLGDFNTEPDAPELTGIRAILADLQEACGMGQMGTYPYHGKTVRIDFVFAGPRWQPLNCWVWPDKASDHYPVLAEAALDDAMPSDAAAPAAP